MTSDSTRPTVPPFQAEAELELLQFILQADQTYPWNPYEAEAEAYFANLEQEVLAAGWTEDEIATQGQALSAQFDQLWATVAPAQDPTRSLVDELFQQFAAQVPHEFLDGIVQRARQVLSTNLSLSDKLVSCVKELLPAWGEDDLLVLARPYAYAMRSAELESTLTSVPSVAWSDLSSIEQARLSLAIARYAISQLPSDTTQA
ncbi:MAG TPA: hypothetical protein V6C78_21320 [Crinalium sp.]|jgi:hypothetical protein